MNIEQRIAKVVTVEDAENQIRLAKVYVQTLRAKSKQDIPLENKLSLNEKLKQAEQTLRQFRRYIFDIEDAIAAGKPPLSVLGR